MQVQDKFTINLTKINNLSGKIYLLFPYYYLQYIDKCYCFQNLFVN